MSQFPMPDGQPPTDPKAAAAAAKAYAKAQRPWYKKKRFIIPLGLVALIAIISAATNGSGSGDEPATNAPHSESPTQDAGQDDTKATQPSKEEDSEPQADVTVLAVKIVKEFETNELAADEKYKGKILQISGRVNEIDTDLFDEDKYILRIGGGGDFELLTVNCNDMPKSELSTLSVGDKVTVIGEFDDGGDLGVEVRDCRLK